MLQLTKNFHPDFRTIDKKPLGPVEIDWTNPISRGLRLVTLLNEAGRDTVNIVTGEPLPAGSAITKVARQEGMAMQGVVLSANSKISYTLDPNGEDWAGVTISALVEMDDGGQSSYFPGIVTNVPTGEFHGNWNLTLEKDTTPRYDFAFRGGNNTTLSHTRIVRFANGDIVNVGGIYSAVSGNRFIKSMLNGVKLGEASVTNSWTATAPTSAIGHYLRGTNRSFPGKVFYVFIWDRPLSEAEYRTFELNPNSLLRPSLPAAYFLPSGAPAVGRVMSSLVGAGGLAGLGGIAGHGGGLAG